MKSICNKKNENKNEENQLIILKQMKYCTTFIADKNKPVTFFSCHLKEAFMNWFLCIVIFILYFESYWCGKSDCNFFWDIRYLLICLFYFFIHSLIYLVIYLDLFTYLNIHLSTYLFIYSFIYLFCLQT